MKNGEHLPRPLRAVLETTLQAWQKHLPGLLRSFHIIGSIAQGAFNEKFSDIDAVAELERIPTPAEVQVMVRFHKALEKQFPHWKLSLWYWTSALPYPTAVFEYHDGRLTFRESFALDPISQFILARQRITLLGEEESGGLVEPSAKELKNWTLSNQSEYWQPWTRHPLRFVMLLSNWGVQWAVLGILRQYYTLREGDVTTKEGAGQYGLKHLPQEWHALIREALALRNGERAFRPLRPFHRAGRTIALLRFVIDQCQSSG